jgi:hypothetical protein
MKKCNCGRRYLAVGVRRPKNYFFYEIDTHKVKMLWRLYYYSHEFLKSFKLFRTQGGYHLIGELKKDIKWYRVWNYFKRRIKTDFKNSKKHGFVQVLRVSAKYDAWGQIVNPAPELIISYKRVKRIPRQYFLIYWTKKK